MEKIIWYDRVRNKVRILHRDKDEGDMKYIIMRRRQTGLVAPSVETDV